MNFIPDSEPPAGPSGSTTDPNEHRKLFREIMRSAMHVAVSLEILDDLPPGAIAAQFLVDLIRKEKLTNE